MKVFEQRYEKKIPVFAGDFTPYWEDGAMSTAREEVLVKHSVERLYQSSVLNTLMFPGSYNSAKYYRAWRNALLWHEHTWGAWNSISAPDAPNVITQWEYKQNFALQADTLSRQLLEQKLNSGAANNGVINVINTSSWNRTDLVTLTKEQSSAGDIIVDEKNAAYPSQRLSNGSLMFLAKDIPALGSKKFYIKKGNSSYKSGLKITGELTIENAAIKLTLDKNTGAIKSLVNNKTGLEFVDGSKYKGLNQYLYMPGLDPGKAVTVDNAKIVIKENGPLIATLEVTVNAPGTNGLKQEISLVNELNKIDITDIVDKEKVRTKESVHFVFPVNVQNGQMRMDLGTGILLPGKNQLPGANKDYLSIQRWADVSNDNAGLTFITNEVPLIEEGEMVNELPYASSNSFGGVSSEKKWKEQSNLSNTFFSYAMNNYWYTNYKADQQGPVTFHYSIYLHNQFDAALVNRQGRANGQPLLLTTANEKGIQQAPFMLNDDNILLTSVKPATSGKGIVIRLYNSSSTGQRLQFNWNKATGGKYSKIYLSNAKEDKVKPFDLQEVWPAFAVKTLYIE
jgi:alpha-mannosidase